jgi:hypothetical protein
MSLLLTVYTNNLHIRAKGKPEIRAQLLRVVRLSDYAPKVFKNQEVGRKDYIKKIQIIQSGIELAPSRHTAQYLNRLQHRVPPYK